MPDDSKQSVKPAAKSDLVKVAQENPDLPLPMIKDILTARSEDASDTYEFD